jgi:hypothetical protein
MTFTWMSETSGNASMGRLNKRRHAAADEDDHHQHDE